MKKTTESLVEKKCEVCEGGIPPLPKEEIDQYLIQMPQWSLTPNAQAITRQFEFKGFQKAVLFANAVAWLAIQEGHHPEVEFGVGYCKVTFSIHAIAGLTDNDFICAAKVNRLYA